MHQMLPTICRLSCMLQEVLNIFIFNSYSIDVNDLCNSWRYYLYIYSSTQLRSLNKRPVNCKTLWHQRTSIKALIRCIKLGCHSTPLAFVFKALAGEWCMYSCSNALMIFFCWCNIHRYQHWKRKECWSILFCFVQ